MNSTLLAIILGIAANQIFTIIKGTSRMSDLKSLGIITVIYLLLFAIVYVI